ncbi:TetR/AcrR family transcriptional regulator [Nocardia puris]|uniref:TetR family transcriptional regulator n=2 Tax=Nocardia puris TaxID=208602 RepID=A0A366DVN9_9NOCA|nr:TetR/AcrR family transcriptional regulator [Nocardia puris]MBF6368305.1 TetR/AcrR family transcriptional regulator [Nocardia puris]MBF6457977.1 TetR/AcrR family transcriptional regulator [Nocardia puris]RBO94137.1 TetR family transcriptional regulator [Nocardia puris]
MIAGAIESLRVHGASATSVDRVLAETGAPRGSVYHHFPGGRTQLITDAITTAGEVMSAYIEDITREGEPFDALDRFANMWRKTLRDSDFRAGCPIFAVAVETNDDAPQFAAVAAEVFARWQAALAEGFSRYGMPADRARRLATLTVTAMEGAIALCRAQHSLTPLDDIVDELKALYTAR